MAKLIVNAGGLHPSHRRQVLSIAIWKATEADSKMDPRFRSAGVVKGELGTPVNHEHVVTRKFLVDAMLASPKQIPRIMELAVGCLVTREEHHRLTKAKGWGWGRYLNARVPVFDGETSSRLNLRKEHRQLIALAKQASMDLG